VPTSFAWNRPISRLNSVALKYLIQNRKTREYFQQGRWTLDLRNAQEYSDVGTAMTECLRHDLRDIEFVLRFGGDPGRHYSLQLPLPQQFMPARAAL
jgi:hypothetical protein